jgi:hypothetical protein
MVVQQAGEVAQEVKCLPSKHKALSSNPNITKKKRRRRKSVVPLMVLLLFFFFVSSSIYLSK